MGNLKARDRARARRKIAGEIDSYRRIERGRDSPSVVDANHLEKWRRSAVFTFGIARGAVEPPFSLWACLTDKTEISQALAAAAGFSSPKIKRPPAVCRVLETTIFTVFPMSDRA